MKVKVTLDVNENYSETEVNIKTNRITDEIIKVMEFLDKGDSDKITVISKNKIVLIKPEDIFTIYAENGKVIVETNNDKYEIKLRLYELEEKFNELSFIRISKSEIVNIENIEYFESDITGSLGIVFKNGKRSYVSRRYVKKIKERLGV